MTDKDYIDIAINISKNIQFPYGAIVVKEGNIIGRSDKEALVSKSPFAHAELVAIEHAMGEMGDFLCAQGGKDCTMYSSCEPCAMCMGAILYAGIGRLVYAATLEDSARCVNEILIPSKQVAELCKNRKIEIVAEIQREKAVEVMEEWQKRR